ncbi:MAG TPA: twin-arginine translocation signal domain-containing protein [Steroidobacteraceae bacterium]
MTSKTLIPRRDFLGASGVLTGLIAAGSPLALLAPSRAWAIGLKALTSTEGATLMAVARTIAPHDKLDDAAYALVIQSLDSDAAKDAQLLGMLRAGTRQLGAAFASAAEAAQVRSLKAIETMPFFQTMRVKTLGTLYTSPIAYAYFGYEGEAFSKGGYLLRGFNDLHWLPDVPLADSGPIPGA